MTVLEGMKEMPLGTTHRLVVTNEQTGEVEIEMKGCEGGIYIVHQTEDTDVGTRQGAFGTHYALTICSMKGPTVLRDLLNRIGALKIVRESAKALGLDTSL